MTRLIRKSIAMWATAFMVLSTMAVLATAESEEGPAIDRVSQPGPQWKVNDYFRYEYRARSIPMYQWRVSFGGGITGTCDFTGSMDHYEHFAVTSNSNAEFFQVLYTRESWENGTYIFRPNGYQPSTTGNYKYYTKVVSSSPQKIRKVDLAQGEATNSASMTQEYTWTSYGKWTNLSQTETSVQTAVGGYMAFYKFPLDFSKTWQLSGVTMDHRTGTQTTEPDENGDFDTATYDLTDTQTWTSGTGRTDTQANSPPQETPSGTYDDCFKIDLSGYYDFSETGTVVVNNVPNPPVNTNQAGNYWATTRWYSNKAGNICNYNSTQLSNGLRLSDKQYKFIPPNWKPEMETLGGQQWAPNLPAIPVREGEPLGIDFTVIDHDVDDEINWSVVSIVGSSSNPQGATLMDNPPQFKYNPTQGNVNQVHSNTLTITAKQPKTVDRDEYTLTVKVDDGRDGGNMTFAFKVKVQNVNSKPYVAMNVPEITMRENSTMTCTTWKLTDIFKDQDRDAGIIDPLTFTAVVTAGPYLTMNIDQDTGIVTFTIPDYAADQTPMSSWDSTIKFTCTDSGSGTPANKLSNNTNAKMHIEHVNHDPQLSSPNGTDLAENGLVWAGDQPDSRLDLNKAFFDPDVKYAEDSLTFSWSGQKHISVKNNAGRITLTPEIYWNGKETIKFKAVDKLGRSKELRLDCTILPVNHLPQFCETDMEITWDNEEALTIKEANSPTATNTKLLLAVTVNDPDTLYGSDTHSCMWYVNDTNGNTVYKSARFSLNDDDYEFRAQFTGAFSASGSPYEVKVVVKDNGGLLAAYIWNVTVLDMNRPPSARFDSPIDNKTFVKGKKIYFDGWNSTDLDEAKENLTYIWNSSRQGMIKQDRGQAGAQFSYGSLKVGKHVITLTVMDSSGGESVVAFTVKITEPSTTPGFEGVILIAAVSVVVALVAWRRKQV